MRDAYCYMHVTSGSVVVLSANMVLGWMTAVITGEKYVGAVCHPKTVEPEDKSHRWISAIQVLCARVRLKCGWLRT